MKRTIWENLEKKISTLFSAQFRPRFFPRKKRISAEGFFPGKKPDSFEKKRFHMRLNAITSSDGDNPETTSCSVVKFYSATDSIARFRIKLCFP
jgi:hypothetical protein